MLRLRAISNAEQSRDVECITGDLRKIVVELTFLVGIVTNDVAADKSAWKILYQDFPSKLFHE